MDPLTTELAPAQIPPPQPLPPVFEEMVRLVAVGESATHGQLRDVRVTLRDVISPGRPLVMLCPHADDGAISAAGLLHEFAIRRGLPVVEVLVFAGERHVDAPWLNDRKKVSVREREFRLECEVLGAEAVCWDLEAYRNPGYRPSAADLEKVVSWFADRRPGAVIIPPATDAHAAHRMTRALAAIGLLGSGLSDTVVLTGWTPWGPLARPDAFFPYDAEAERTKDWAIHCHASQVLLTDYTEFCSHLGRAYAALTREWAGGHSLSAGRGRGGGGGEDRFVGVELFQVERPEPQSPDRPPTDPIQVALHRLRDARPAPEPPAAV